MRSGFLMMLMVSVIFGGGYWYYVAEAICDLPVSYRIGAIDPRFNIGEEYVRNRASVAESMWENATERNIFTYDPSGDVTINFVFDDRQATANEEEELRGVLETKEGVSETVRDQYDRLLGEYTTLKKSYEKRTSTYESNLAAYNTEVAKWNEKGGAPKDVFEELKQTGERLAREQRTLNELATSLNKLVGQMNALGAKGTTLINDYNEVVNEYNDKFTEGSEFAQGEYKADVITIYEFTSDEELEIVLAHEFGHALALGHVEGESSIMYHLMEAQNKESGVTEEDIAEFNRLCGSEATPSKRLYRFLSSMWKS